MHESIRRRDRWPLVAATVLTFAVVANGFWIYAAESSTRFRQLHHDRNTHYLQSIEFALRLRAFDVIGLLGDILDARTWPPLRNLLSGAAMALAGIGPASAVTFDSLAFGATAVLAFLLAGRLAPGFPNLAGWIAATFVLASPAFRVYATDIMFESLGACLTLAAIYAWVIARSDWSVDAATPADAGRESVAKRRWRCWAGLMTALFLTKYNYWMLAVLALSVGEILSNPHWISQAVSGSRQIPWRGVLRYAVRQPLTLPLLASLAATAFWLPRGGGAFQLFGQDILIEEKCYNLLSANLWLAIGWAAPWWIKSGRKSAGRWPLAVRTAFFWHFVPVVSWLALPKRLGYFVWYLSPRNGPVHPDSPIEYLGIQWRWWSHEYHAGPWMLAIAGTLTLVAVAATAVRYCGRIRAGRKPATSREPDLSPRRHGIAVVASLLAISAVLTVCHPQHYDRYSHSWIASLWVLAGVGLSEGLCLLHRRYGLASGPIGASVAICLWGAMLPEMFRPGHSIDEGHRRLASSRPLAECYLGELIGGQTVRMFATQPFGAFLKWSVLEKHASGVQVETFVKRLGRDVDSNDRRLREWLDSANEDVVVTVEVPETSPLYYPGFDHYRQSIEFMRHQSRYLPTKSQDSDLLGCRVTVWKPVSAIARLGKSEKTR